MNILVLGGTRFFGVHMVKELIGKGHEVMIATRGLKQDPYGDHVQRITIERTDRKSLKEAFRGMKFDVACDNLAYSSNDVKYLLDSAEIERYVMTSSASVYRELHPGVSEKKFDPLVYPLVWCSREEYPYNETKRQAECALYQAYPLVPSVSVRFPYVIGGDDYTKRLYFYVEHIVKGIPMYVNNLDEKLGFVRSSDAGAFLAWMAEQCFTGPINGSNRGNISLRTIINYVEEKTTKKALMEEDGEPGPYNGAPEYELDISGAEQLGFCFSSVEEWIFELLDEYIQQAGL